MDLESFVYFLENITVIYRLAMECSASGVRNIKDLKNVLLPYEISNICFSISD